MRFMIKAAPVAALLLVATGALAQAPRTGSPGTPAPYAQTPPAATGRTPATSAAPAPAPGATGQFTTEAAARQHCPSDTVVWVNLGSKAYHASGTKYYGKTKRGAYMCQKEADQSGFHAAGRRAATKG
jgi:hypothetical protein